MSWPERDMENKQITEEVGDHDQDYKPWSRLLVSNKSGCKVVSSRFGRASVIIIHI